MARDPQDVFDALKETLVKEFEVDPAAITPAARLQEDLDLDSIDAVDLILKIQELTGQSVSPEQFKDVVTIGDVQAIIANLQRRAGVA